MYRYICIGFSGFKKRRKYKLGISGPSIKREMIKARYV